MVAALGRFTQDQLDHLRREYAVIETVDPTIEGGAYDRLCKMLDRMSQAQLSQLKEAKIKWVSSLARNRIRRAA